MTTSVVFKSSKGRKEHLNQSWLKFSLCFWECKQKKTKTKDQLACLATLSAPTVDSYVTAHGYISQTIKGLTCKHISFAHGAGTHSLYALLMPSFPLKTVYKRVKWKKKTGVPVNIFERAQEIQVRITGGALSLWRSWGTVMTDTSGAFSHTQNLTHYAHLVALGSSFHIKRCNVKALRRTRVWLMRRARGRVQVVVYPCHGRKARMQGMDG